MMKLNGMTEMVTEEEIIQKELLLMFALMYLVRLSDQLRAVTDGVVTIPMVMAGPTKVTDSRMNQLSGVT